jgi:hypothetical protein
MTIDKPSRGAFLLLLAAVLYLTLIPTPPHVALDNLPYGDKIEHFTAFGALALPPDWAFRACLRGWCWNDCRFWAL